MTVIALSREVHANKRFKPVRSFSFAAKAALVRILAAEAAQIALNFPIVFFRENNVTVPFVLLGARQDENLFVSEQGQWLAPYMPALVRCYPFSMGKATTADPKPNEFSLLVDDDFLSDDEGEPVFGSGEGELNGPAARAIRLLSEIAVQNARTTSMSNAIVKSGVLEPLLKQAGQDPNGPARPAGLEVVSEAKLNALPDDQFLELRRSGALGLIYAQLISLAQFARLSALAANRQNKSATPA